MGTGAKVDPRVADHRTGLARENGGRRDIVRVVGRVVAMRMAGAPFVGPAVFVAVPVAGVVKRQNGMALDFGEGECGRVVRGGVVYGCQQHMERHGKHEREAKNPAVAATRHDQRLYITLLTKGYRRVDSTGIVAFLCVEFGRYNTQFVAERFKLRTARPAKPRNR